MTPQELPDKLTPCSTTDLVTALYRAWVALFNEPPSPRSLWVLGAQWALETGWGKSCHCWNFGNVKHSNGDGRCWTFFRCNEIINGKVVWFDPPNPGCCFRAFETINEGALEYLAFLRKHYSPAWSFVLAGDPAGFVHSIKLMHYFTADETTYRNNVVSIWNTFSRVTIDYDTLMRSPVPPDASVDYVDLLELARSDMASERDTEVAGG